MSLNLDIGTNKIMSPSSTAFGNRNHCFISLITMIGRRKMVIYTLFSLPVATKQRQ